MKIAISGYGKMGKVIEEIAIERGHTISYKISSSNKEQWRAISPENTDVIIEFSTPDTVVENIQKSFNVNVPIVVGTTGWGHAIEQVSREAEKNERALLHASNFSIGVNLFFELNKQLTRLMAPFKDYKPHLEETHHIHKKDAPSGTAISLANDLIEGDDRFEDWQLTPGLSQGKLPITAHRENEVPGTHVISYDSEIDSISIKHEARSRKGFALGSVVAAEWLKDRKGVYTMKDVLQVKLS